MAFKSYIGYNFGEPEVFYGGGEARLRDDTPPSIALNTGFEWLGASGSRAEIGKGYIVTLGRLIITYDEEVACTGTKNTPGIVFVELKRSEGSYIYDLKCNSISGFPGHTVDAWRFPIYAVYLNNDGDASVLYKLTSGVISA